MNEILRWTGTGLIVGGTSLRTTEILSERLPLSDLAEFVSVGKGHAIGSYMFGAATVLLALAGSYTLTRADRAQRGFGWLMVMALLLVFVLPAWFVLLWTYIPGLSHVRHLSILATPLMLAIAILAGRGFSELQTIESPKVNSRLVIVTALFIAGLCVWGYLRSPTQPIFLYLSLGICLTIAGLTLTRTLAVRRIGLFVVLVLHTIAQTWIIPRSDGVPAITGTSAWKSLEASVDWIATNDPNPGRLVFHASINQEKLYPDFAGTTAAYRKIPTIHFTMSPRISWRYAAESMAWADYPRIGAKYVIAMADLVDPNLSEVFREGEGRVYRFRDPRPWAATACVGGVPFEPIAGGALLERRPGRLPDLPPPQVQALIPALYGKLDCPGADRHSSWLDKAKDQLVWEVPPGVGRVVVINMPPYASWHLTVAGRPLQAYNVDNLQTVAFVPDDLVGTAVLAYQPSDYAWRLRVSKSGWLFLLSAVAFLLFREMKRFYFPMRTEGR